MIKFRLKTCDHVYKDTCYQFAKDNVNAAIILGGYKCIQIYH